MKYLCLLFSEEAAWGRMSKAEQDAGVQQYAAYSADLKASGHYVTGQRLQPVSSATVVRMRDGKMSTTDGPYAETKEQLGGYYLIEAKDLNEALQVASRCPGAHHGSIEVRPLFEM
jgi:hypothetical protein